MSFCVRTWPINFRETDRGTLSDGGISFAYERDSESGSVSDLTDVDVGESISCDPTPRPPYAEDYPGYPSTFVFYPAGTEATVTLKPGRSFQEVIVLDEWLRLPPGEHIVLCENSAAHLETRFTLTILPLDRQELRARITRLIKQAQKRGVINFADPAVRALRVAVRKSPLCKVIVTTAPEARADLKDGLENDPTD